MTLALPSRRLFLRGLAGLVAAPAIVRAASLMPMKAVPAFVDMAYDKFGNPYEAYTSWFKHQELLKEWRYIASIADGPFPDHNLGVPLPVFTKLSDS